jgi:hypothetical protein
MIHLNSPRFWFELSLKCETDLRFLEMYRAEFLFLANSNFTVCEDDGISLSIRDFVGYDVSVTNFHPWKPKLDPWRYLLRCLPDGGVVLQSTNVLYGHYVLSPAIVVDLDWLSIML